MSLGTLQRSPQDQRLKTADSCTSTAFSSLSSHTDCPSYTGPESGSEVLSICRISPDCTSCLGEPDILGCIDPTCPEITCDECFNHEGCCDDCVVDCGSDCEISFDCDELNIRVDGTYSFEGSHSELFGDQTAQTFGFGRRLPQLAMENTITESNDSGKVLDDTALSTIPAYGMNQSYMGFEAQPNSSSQVPWAPHALLNFPQATTPDRPNLTTSDTSHGVPKSASLIYPSDSTHGSPDSIGFTASAHYDHINLLAEKSDSTAPFPSSLPCQWADSNGEQCGQTLRLGNDMHEHLKSVHGVKSEVVCRWVGCSVGVLGASPHRFANSVERHTWGHSGFRPYKCSACNEGFAAASVRDEHFTNIHLRQKVFSCDMCHHQCTSATNLKRHKVDKHSAERFQCEFCHRNGKRRLFPRGANLARHLRNCKYVQAQFPESTTAGTANADWLPPGYKRGHRGMDRAKVTPPNYLLMPNDT